jgi:hypothetical protein
MYKEKTYQQTILLHKTSLWKWHYNVNDKDSEEGQADG